MHSFFFLEYGSVCGFPPFLSRNCPPVFFYYEGYEEDHHYCEENKHYNKYHSILAYTHICKVIDSHVQCHKEKNAALLRFHAQRSCFPRNLWYTVFLLLSLFLKVEMETMPTFLEVDVHLECVMKYNGSLRNWNFCTLHNSSLKPNHLVPILRTISEFLFHEHLYLVTYASVKVI